MSLDAELQSIVRECEGDLLGFARKLYEHGYRQGLSSRPEPPEGIASTRDHRISGSLSAAGLQKRIERIFDLARFDIEVVICRRGDPDRRRLRSAVKLKNYLLEDR